MAGKCIEIEKTAASGRGVKRATEERKEAGKRTSRTGNAARTIRKTKIPKTEGPKDCKSTLAERGFRAGVNRQL